MDNGILEAVPGLADKWRVPVIDPGRIVRVADGSANTARDIRLTPSRLDRRFLRDVTKDPAHGLSISKSRSAFKGEPFRPAATP